MPGGCLHKPSMAGKAPVPINPSLQRFRITRGRAGMIRSPGQRGPSAGHVDQEPGPGFDHQGGSILRSMATSTRNRGRDSITKAAQFSDRWPRRPGTGAGIRSPRRLNSQIDGHVDQEPGPGFDHPGGQRSPPSATRGAGSTTPQNTLTLRLCWARGRSRTTRRTKRIA